jgi:NYN domain
VSRPARSASPPRSSDYRDDARRKRRSDGQKTVKVYKTEEKGSDVNVATYLLLDAFKRNCDLAVVISNDSDLEAPIRAVMQDLGVPVGLLNPHPAYSRSP